MEFAGKRILIIGMARSGVAAAKVLAKRGARLTVCDCKTGAELEDSTRKLAGLGIEVYTGGYPPMSRADHDLLIVSPGVPLDIEPLKTAREVGLPVISELELAYCLKSPAVEMYAVSGTNGKTTTVSLLRDILVRDGRTALAGGNIGVPLSALVDDMTAGALVVEASSFQLETTFSFRPRISALLNVTPDHLDRHKTMRGYMEAKARLFARQEEDDHAVLNYEDACVRKMAELCPARIVYFSAERVLAEGAFIKDDLICFAFDGQVKTICPVKEVSLRGRHNLENVLCAAAVAALAGAKTESIRETLQGFAAVRHRLEEAGTVDGVLYVNDSKATNPQAAIKALESFTEPIILLAGGRSKGSDFCDFARVASDKVKELVLLGEARAEIRKAVMAVGFENIHEVDDFKAAVETARRLAAPGDVVLLSPACASWDMFASYEDRGDVFCALVSGMQKKRL